MTPSYSKINIVIVTYFPIGCTYRGQTYEQGEVFRNPEERCEDCVCRDGTVECLRRQCDVPNCRDPVYPPGACCPECAGIP